MSDSPSKIIALFESGDISYEEMIHALQHWKLSPGFTYGKHDPDEGDGYVQGTWDDVRHAKLNGLINDSDYEALRRPPAASSSYAAGVIPTAAGILDLIAAHAAKYKVGELDAYSFDRLIDRTLRQLNRRACWCAEGVCCQVHGRHVTPHQRCILR